MHCLLAFGMRSYRSPRIGTRIGRHESRSTTWTLAGNCIPETTVEMSAQILIWIGPEFWQKSITESNIWITSETKTNLKINLWIKRNINRFSFKLIKMFFITKNNDFLFKTNLSKGISKWKSIWSFFYVWLKRDGIPFGLWSYTSSTISIYSYAVRLQTTRNRYT